MAFWTTLFLAGGAVQASAQWKAGIAAQRITPDQPLRMAGYAARVEVFKGVARDLFAKALVLEDEAGRRVALVTVDLIGIRAEIARAVVAKIPAAAGLGPGQVILSASHSHSGPDLLLDPSPRDGWSAADAPPPPRTRAGSSTRSRT